MKFEIHYLSISVS